MGEIRTKSPQAEVRTRRGLTIYHHGKIDSTGEVQSIDCHLIVAELNSEK